MQKPFHIELHPIALFAWLRYEVDCEIYDRGLPGRMVNGEHMPFDRVSMLRFARVESNATDIVLREREVPRKESNRAHEYVCELTHEQRVRLLDEMTKPKTKRAPMKVYEAKDVTLTFTPDGGEPVTIEGGDALVASKPMKRRRWRG